MLYSNTGARSFTIIFLCAFTLYHEYPVDIDHPRKKYLCLTNLPGHHFVKVFLFKKRVESIDLHYYHFSFIFISGSQGYRFDANIKTKMSMPVVTLKPYTGLQWIHIAYLLVFQSRTYFCWRWCHILSRFITWKDRFTLEILCTKRGILVRSSGSIGRGCNRGVTCGFLVWSLWI